MKLRELPDQPVGCAFRGHDHVAWVLVAPEGSLDPGATDIDGQQITTGGPIMIKTRYRGRATRRVRSTRVKVDSAHVVHYVVGTGIVQAAREQPPAGALPVIALKCAEISAWLSSES